MGLDRPLQQQSAAGYTGSECSCRIWRCNVLPAFSYGFVLLVCEDTCCPYSNFCGCCNGFGTFKCVKYAERPVLLLISIACYY